jgi:hypothetical protein
MNMNAVRRFSSGKAFCRRTRQLPARTDAQNGAALRRYEASRVGLFVDDLTERHHGQRKP